MVETLGHTGVLSTEQIAKRFFQNTRLTTVRRRLRKLEKEDLIYRVHGLDNGGVAWAITKSAAQKIGCKYPVRYFNRNSLAHDVMLSEVRHVLESIGLAENWVPEHVLKAQAVTIQKRAGDEKSFVPDAIFSIKHQAQTRVVALELELNGKNRKRYENILNRYRWKKKLWAVWYLVPSESLGETLEDVWKRINFGKRNDLLIWSVIPKLLQDPLEVHVRGEQILYPLKNLISTQTQTKSPALPGALPGSRPSDRAATELAEAVL